MASSAFNTEILIYVSMLIYYINSIFRAGLNAFMGKTASAGLSYHKSVDRTFITGVMQDINYICAFERFNGIFCSFLYNMTFLVYTASCDRFRSGDKFFCYFIKRTVQCTVNKSFCYFLIYKIFCILYIALKFFNIKYKLLPHLFPSSQAAS